MPKTAELIRPETVTDVDVDLDREIACECMVCDLPLGQPHEPVEWRVHLHFPGPYPMPGDEVMLLCDHCRDDWVDGSWNPPYDNFRVVSCIRV